MVQKNLNSLSTVTLSRKKFKSVQVLIKRKNVGEWTQKATFRLAARQFQRLLREAGSINTAVLADHFYIFFVIDEHFPLIWRSRILGLR